ncbi:MAG: peptidylprolyl isomerase [Peptococcaceae bacterium]|nr:peptidylprolyl isomerase [Peptococcaceae bacterium]
MSKAKAYQSNRMTEQNPWRDPFRWVIVGMIAVGVIVITVVSLYNRGIPQRYTTALTVGNEKINVGEYNFYRKSYYDNFLQTNGAYLSYMGLDTNLPLDEQSYSEDQTWADFIREQTVIFLQREIALSNEAQKEGVALTDEEQRLITTYLNNIRSSARAGGLSLNAYLEETFGAGVTVGILEKAFERSFLAQSYTEKKSGERQYTQEELDNYYGEHADEIDLVDYRTFQIYPQLPEEADEEADEEANGAEGTDDPAAVDEAAAEATEAAAEAAREAAEAAAQEEAKAKAEAMLAAITDEASFNAQAYEYAEESSKTYYEDPDATLQTGVGQISVSGTPVGDWLFDSERKADDKTVLESDGAFHVLYFLRRAREDYRTVSVRHILIQPEQGDEAEATDEQKAAALSEAEAAYDEWLAGEQTEDSFAALVEKYSEDGGSSANGGLYENVYKGQMVKPFEDWCFDSGRKPGDTGIVETDYGYHVMYYVGEGEVRWETVVKESLETQAYQEMLEESVNQYPVEENSSGMKLVTL